MQEDNAYPTHGGDFYSRPEKTASINPEEKAVNEKRDIIEETVRWFDEQIEALDSVDSISFKADVETEKFIRAWAINRGMKDNFERKKAELITLLEDYPKR
jgi:hypothetical protein